MKPKNVIFLAFYFFMFWLIIICKNIVIFKYNNDVVEIQTWAP
jgi:hypothetical protein